ncbi:YtxH domain-containing protein [Arcticibacter eurypsychrophilus]|uniref:YtxH domain-containing protein n=1 Tax=Arcticibacter eurypsychrophilus TaxID=1434752 RepID=UPI00084E063A|nr:YtxH domain-containing protein [Arcticibacter eurypsychrophilus]
MNDDSKVLLALLAGIAAGAALGILFAPEKGTETRDKFNDALKNLGDTIKDRAAEEIDNLASLKDKIVDNIKSTLGSLEDDIDEVKNTQSEPA